MRSSDPDPDARGRLTSRSTWALIGAVIAHVPAAIERLEVIGFRAEFRAPDGTYLVRRAKPAEVSA